MTISPLNRNRCSAPVHSYPAARLIVSGFVHHADVATPDTSAFRPGQCSLERRRTDFLKHGLDLPELDACLYNELEEKHSSMLGGTRFPIEVVTDQNLPMPIFIRGDDVEYGLAEYEKSGSDERNLCMARAIF